MVFYAQSTGAVISGRLQSRGRLTAGVRTEGTEQRETDSESENRGYRAEGD